MAKRHVSIVRTPRSRRRLRLRIHRLERENRRLRNLFPDGRPCGCAGTSDLDVCEAHRAHVARLLDQATMALEQTIDDVARDAEVPRPSALRIVMELRSVRGMLGPAAKETAAPNRPDAGLESNSEAEATV